MLKRQRVKIKEKELKTDKCAWKENEKVGGVKRHEDLDE